MLVKPRLGDFKVIGFYTGSIIIGVGLLMLVPLLAALIFGEWNPVFDFLIGIFSCLSLGFFLHLLCRTKKHVTWTHGLVVTAFSWLVATALGAIPHYLSGHFGSYLDAVFDVMSGYTTTGLYLLQDLDHVSNALNTWRHLLSFAGGQGIIVVALTFLIKGTSGILKMYIAEGKEEQLLPNVIQTARAIWLISLSYLVVGSLALWLVGVLEGMPPVRGLLHGFWVSMSAWSTAGFAPQSFNIGYYHSLPWEIVTVVLFTSGGFNFALHWAIWTGNRREIYRNLEIVTMAATFTILFLITTLGLIKGGVYPDALAIFRKSFYVVASGHTGTGFATVYPREFVNRWGELAMLGVTIAMALGAGAASTAGGFKALRVGIFFKALIHDTRRLISPESSVVIQKFHHIKDVVLEPNHVRAAGLIIISYIGIYFLGAVVGTYYGYPLSEALFDSVSSGANVGLSAGVTSPSMPALMKVVYIFEMWAGRLEFLAIGTLIGFVVAAVRGK